MLNTRTGRECSVVVPEKGYTQTRRHSWAVCPKASSFLLGGSGHSFVNRNRDAWLQGRLENGNRPDGVH